MSLDDEDQYPGDVCHKHRKMSKASGVGSSREKWPRRSEFLLMLFGYTVGLGNVWRFPYLCHKNGGASFLIPYFIILAVEGMPLYYMELCLGQRLRNGSVGVWHLVSPYLDGLGFASVVICIMVCLYYNVILSWCLIYFVNSFKNPLPWSECPKVTITKGNQTFQQPNAECEKAGPTSYFWYRTTLDISEDIESGNEINWTIAFSLLFAWLVVWLCMVKRIKSEGKVVYVTATLPLILLGAMFFRGVNLDGFQQGLALLFVPEFSRLKDPLVWLDAATQTFYSLGIAYGSLIAFASYNPLKNDTTRDAITICLIDAGVSVYASVVIFCFIGYRAELKMHDCLAMLGLNHTESESYEIFVGNATVNGNITEIVCSKKEFLAELSQSTGLAFITFTDAINTLPQAQMWSILFFLMLLMLGVDTQFGMLEGLFTPLFDANPFPKLRKEIVTGIVCLAIYLPSLIMTQHSGNYWLQIIENYSVGIPLLVVALCEVISISYLYGIERFCNDIEYMTNKRPNKIWVICWKIISPALIVFVLIFSIKDLCTKSPTYQVWVARMAEGKYVELPPWAIVFAVLLMFSSLIMIPVVALLKYFKIIKKGSSPGRLGLSLSKKTRGRKQRNGNDIASVHRPLQAMESNTFSMATEFSDNMFKL
uniref:Transporter n=3 Tax=Clytia hemisphaerica TaxID=252671 RepID=A0A7M5WTB9_9CNID